MSRIVRFREPPQPTLSLGHGLVHWDTLPDPVRQRVLALWMQLLAEHLAHVGRDQADRPSLAAVLALPGVSEEGDR